jgi:hypothetical protein
MKKLNKRTFDINLKNIRNNRHEYNKHTISLRPTYVSDLKNERSSLKPNINKLTLNISEQNKEINNNANRYNIFVNYKSRGNNNYDKNYYKRNNYYFNNCNFINNNNNNPNENCLVNNPYNNNYLRNPYSNNYNLYNNCNQMYKEYFNNFMKYLSLRNQKNENENKISLNNNLLNENDKENKKRKIIYEKISIKRDGNEYKYQKGPVKIQYVGGGNYYNQCHKAIIKNNSINNNKNYGIQNLFLNGNKQKNGPRIILPNKMFS